MKKYTAIMLALLTAGFVSAQSYDLASPTVITATVSGFTVLRTQSLPDGSWEILANVNSTLPLYNTEDPSDATVSIKPIRVTVMVSQAEVATSLGIDVSVEGWESQYYGKSILELQTAVIVVAQTKIIATVE